MWITTNCGKFLRRLGYQTTLPVSWETCMQVKKQQLETDMKQWTGSKLRQEYVKAIYYLPAYLTSMQSTSCEMLGWMNHKLESSIPELSVTSDDTTLKAESEWEQKKRTSGRGWKRSEKAGIWSHQFLADKWGKCWNSDRFYFLGLQKSLQMVTAAMKLKDARFLGGKLWQTLIAY